MITERKLSEKDFLSETIAKLKSTKIIADPFPHIVIEEFFLPSFYKNLLENFPNKSNFKKATYPGTGHGETNSNYHDFGLVCPVLTTLPYYREIDQFMSSEEFSRILLNKFSSNLPDYKGKPAIPEKKHIFFKNGATDFTTVFNLQVDLPGYEIAPHRDVDSKIVTFQFFLAKDSSMREFGTHLLAPKNNDFSLGRSRLATRVNNVLNKVVNAFGIRDHKITKKIECSKFGLWCGFGPTQQWLPWEKLDIVKTIPALPNCFMAFAPNDRSYHAVRMNATAASACQERPVIRGFIRSGRNTENWISIKES